MYYAHNIFKLVNENFNFKDHKSEVKADETIRRKISTNRRRRD